MINISENRVIASSICRCSACHVAIQKRPYFRTENGWLCEGCLLRYRVHGIDAKRERNRLQARLCS